MKSSTHGAAVLGGGVAGFCVGGPVGAVAGGVAAGTVCDGTITLVTDKPYGFAENVENLQKKDANVGKEVF